MEWYWILLLALGAFVALYTLLCYFVARYVLKAATTPVAHTLDEARAYQAEHENFDFTDYDTVWRKEKFEVDGLHGKVRGELVFNDCCEGRKKVVIVCHGHTWNRINSLKYAKIFYDKGYNVVLYDHCYFGESDGTFTSLGGYEQYDLNVIFDLVREKFGKDALVGLHGESMGAATVLLELGLRHDVDFVVADCPFSDTMGYYREICLRSTHLPGFPIVDMANSMSKRKYGYDFRKVSPIKAVAQSTTPICFIHGKADKFIYPSHSKKMKAVSSNPLSELHLIDGAEHARSYHKDSCEYAKVVNEFLDKVEKENNFG